MHNNFYFLRQLSGALHEAIEGFTLVSCFSQDKAELILEFNNARSSFFIKASLTPGFSCLSFPSSFQRARKNSVDLFSTVVMKNVTGIRQFENERSFSIEFEGPWHLIFKMHGNRSNVALLGMEGVVELFRNQFKADLSIQLDRLDRTIDWSRDFFDNHQHELGQAYYTFGTVVWRYLNHHGFESASPDRRWELLTGTRERLEHPEYYILEGKPNVPVFSLLPDGPVISRHDNPIEAITKFFSQFMTSHSLHLERSAALKGLETRLVAGLNYIEKNERKLRELVPDIHYQQWADLIMANMNQITPGLERIVVANFYDNNQPLEIRLKRELNAQRNAEAFYRKAKNQQIEIRNLKESIDTRQREIHDLKEKIAAINNEPGLSNIRKLLNETKKAKHAIEEGISLPYHEFEYKGFAIWVGKNASANDTLTQQYSHKDDLWLHAKDVAGSHVLIKHQAGKPFPKDVIERAAALAAYYSKRRHDTMCPVAVTPKKFVRKRKGAPAGSVVVDREEVVLVTPSR